MDVPDISEQGLLQPSIAEFGKPCPEPQKLQSPDFQVLPNSEGFVAKKMAPNCFGSAVYI